MNIRSLPVAICHTVTSLLHGEGSVIDSVKAAFGGHRTFGEEDLQEMEEVTEFHEAAQAERLEVRITIERNNNWQLEESHSMTNKKSPKQWFAIFLCPPIIIALTVAGITAFASFIRQNSLDSSWAGAVGLAVSAWAFSPALKIAMGDVLVPWLRVIKVIIFFVMTGAFLVTILELTGHFMIVVEDEGGWGTAGAFGEVLPAAQTATVTSFRTLYLAISLLEVLSVYTLSTAFVNAFGPKQSPAVVEAMKINKALRIEDKRLTKLIATFRGRLAVLSERKRHSESMEAIIKALFEKF